VLLPGVSGSLLVWLARFAQRHPHQRRGLVVVAGNALVLIFLLSVVLLVMETYYRFWCDTTDWYDINRVSDRWYLRHVQINVSGFRDNVASYTLERTPGNRRITFLGDSFTAGHGIADVDDRFANRIRKLKPDWEIHVMAVNGFDTGDEMRKVQYVLSRGYELDDVVLVYCLNDIMDIVPEWRESLKRIYSKPAPGFLCTHSFCLNTWYYWLQGRLDPDIARYDQVVFDAYNGPLWEQQEKRLMAFRGLVESKGGRFMVVMFPFFHGLGPQYRYAPIHKKLDTFWGEMGVPYLDLLELYTSHRGETLTVNSHDAHPNVYAHGLAANAILKFLEQNSRPGDQPRSPVATGSSTTSPLAPSPEPATR